MNLLGAQASLPAWRCASGAGCAPKGLADENSAGKMPALPGSMERKDLQQDGSRGPTFDTTYTRKK